MIITWHGHYTLKIITRGATVIIDPYSPEVSNAPFKAKADYVALSNPSNSAMSHLGGIQNGYRLINTPGEYAFPDLKLFARGWHNEEQQEQNIQRWQIEDTTLLHLGAFNRKFEEKELQELEKTNIDILFLPIGGHTSLGINDAVNLINDIEPSIVIPINYHTSKSKVKLEKVDQFIKEMGASSQVAIDKLSISGKKIDRENLETVILSA